MRISDHEIRKLKLKFVSISKYLMFIFLSRMTSMDIVFTLNLRVHPLYFWRHNITGKKGPLRAKKMTLEMFGQAKSRKKLDH